MTTQYYKEKRRDRDTFFFFGLVEDTLNIDRWLDGDR